MIPTLSFLFALATSAAAVGGSFAGSTKHPVAPAFLHSSPPPSKGAPLPRGRAPRRRTPDATRLGLLAPPEIPLDALLPQQCPSSMIVTTASSVASSMLLSVVEGDAEWRQYVPLVVSVGVIVDILLGSPVANAALGPMKRASEKGASGGNSWGGTGNGGGGDASGGGSLFSSLDGGRMSGGGGVDGRSGRGKERVDSEAIARATLNKAINTLELKRFLEENKTDEQRYEEVRKKIDRQMSELDVD